MKTSVDPYNTAPTKPDPWAQEKVKKDRRRNPTPFKARNAKASAIYAQKSRGPLLWFDGRKFTNNDSPQYFGTRERAFGRALELVKAFPMLRRYRVWIGAPMRRQNPDSRTQARLDAAAQRLEDFSGHAARKVIEVSPRSSEKTGLVIGELDLIGYRTKRVGLAGGKLVRYAHDFSKGSRPLLAVSSDGKQLHIVGGQYEFTEAGIEDR